MGKSDFAHWADENDPRDDKTDAELKAMYQQKRANLEAQDVADFKHLMSTPEGQRFINWVIEMCGYDRGSYTGNSETFFREGQRDIGLRIKARAERMCPRAQYNAMRSARDYD